MKYQSSIFLLFGLISLVLTIDNSWTNQDINKLQNILALAQKSQNKLTWHTISYNVKEDERKVKQSSTNLQIKDLLLKGEEKKKPEKAAPDPFINKEQYKQKLKKQTEHKLQKQRKDAKVGQVFVKKMKLMKAKQNKLAAHLIFAKTVKNQIKKQNQKKEKEVNAAAALGVQTTKEKTKKEEKVNGAAALGLKAPKEKAKAVSNANALGLPAKAKSEKKTEKKEHNEKHKRHRRHNHHGMNVMHYMPPSPKKSKVENVINMMTQENQALAFYQGEIIKEIVRIKKPEQAKKILLSLHNTVKKINEQ